MDKMKNSEVCFLTLSGIEIHSVGQMKAVAANKLYKKRSLDTYGLVYIYEGFGRFYSDSVGMMSVGPGCCLLLYPGISHIYGPLEPDGYWKEFWVLFSGHFIDNLIDHGILDPLNPVIQVSKDHQYGFKDLLQCMHEQFRASQRQAGYTLYGQFYELLFRLLQPGRDDFYAYDVHIQLESMKQLLIRHLYSQEKLETFFYTSKESYHALRIRFKALAGISPKQFIHLQRIQHTKDLLLFSDLSIGKISQQAGYIDQFYFSRIFKKLCGESPKAYRDRFLFDKTDTE